MILCFDIGNSHIFGGVLIGNDIKLRFRYNSNQIGTSDQIGLFILNVLRANGIEPKQLEHVAICSVVPSLDYSFNAACLKYLNTTPFILKPGVKTGLKLDVKNPLEVGSDRIATAIAAIDKFPNKNIIIIDYGTATTHCAISKNKTFLGGTITPGIKISMEALTHNTAKLPAVEIKTPTETLGKTTITNIQSGLYYSQLGASKIIIENLTKEAFQNEKPIIIGTGGFSHLFKDEGLFDCIAHDLVLFGIKIALEKNLKK